MKTRSNSWYYLARYCCSGLWIAWLYSVVATTALAQTPPDLSSTFAEGIENWRTTDLTAVEAWQSSGGAPGGYLQGSRAGSTNAWHFLSPESWAGNWSGYRVLKFDISIPSRHYPDLDRAGMVVIVGANGQQMTWTGSTPLWTWTHYEVSLMPSSFGVDAATFDGIMSSVAELRILAEFTTANEMVGLDNVLVTAAPANAHQTDLVSRFTDSTIQGWRPVDDVTLSAVEDGQPSFGLKANDWMDGRNYKIAAPVSWAGDWRQYRQLSFDMLWTGASAAHADVELIRIFGANGQSLSWSGSLTNSVWTHRSIPLTSESFGVSAGQFEAVMSHVSEMWIVGEFGDGNDVTYLDNVILATSTNNPPRLTHNLVSRFDTGDEGWVVYDLGTMTWRSTNGISGGALESVDAGGGTARFQSPDAWIGDWREFKTLRFMLKSQVSSRSTFTVEIWIITWNGASLTLTLPEVYGSWTPYTLDLSPQTFGVSTNEFDAIMRDVACLWIQSDLVSGTGSADTTLLDNVMLLTETGPGIPPDRWSDFETGNQEWRTGAWNDGPQDWSFRSLANHVATDGHPAGHIENADTGDWTYWFSPESWAGDWRGLQSVSFDFKIISGSSLFDTRMISICSPYTNLLASVSTMPVPGEWMHYEFSLTPATFGVSAELFDKVMRDVVLLGIRSEWVNGSELEGLDNVRLTKASDAYWTWISRYFTGPDLTDENKAGKLADFDGDGADNWSEFIADTVPTNRLDCLRIESITVANGVCALGFNTRTGRRYSVESASALFQTNTWSVRTNDLPGTGAPASLVEPSLPANRFYRLKARLDQ